MGIHAFDLKTVNKIIDIFSSCTDINITVFDRKMNIVAESLSEKKICNFFDIYKTNGVCKKNLSFSAKISFDLGEPYIFSCPSGLVNIAVAIIHDKKFDGCFIAGPLAMDHISEGTIANMLDLNDNFKSKLAKVVLFMKNMKIYTPKQINNLSILFYNNILSFYKNTEDYEVMNSQYKAHLNISENIQKFKKSLASKTKTENIVSSPLEMSLIEKIKSGNKEEASLELESFLNEILLLEVGNFEIMKVRIFELYVQLSKSAIESGASLQQIFGINFDLIDALNNVKNIDDLFNWASNIVDYFITTVFENIYSGQSKIVKEAIEYINNNFMNKISLNSLSQHLHINESYLSKLFKKETNINFTDYLNETRINKSLDLIKNTDLNLMDIALTVGFEDQSYFTKVFKKFVGETPKQYKLKELRNDLI